MSDVKKWFHVVWCTKDREPLITRDNRLVLCKHILDKSREVGVYLDFINGWNEHLHCLIAVNSDTGLDRTIQAIKEESSDWASKNKIILPSLHWEDFYLACPISGKQIWKARGYISNQEKLHYRKSFQEEYEELISKYGFTLHHDS